MSGAQLHVRLQEAPPPLAQLSAEDQRALCDIMRRALQRAD